MSLACLILIPISSRNLRGITSYHPVRLESVVLWAFALCRWPGNFKFPIYGFSVDGSITVVGSLSFVWDKGRWWVDFCHSDKNLPSQLIGLGRLLCSIESNRMIRVRSLWSRWVTYTLHLQLEGLPCHTGPCSRHRSYLISLRCPSICDTNQLLENSDHMSRCWWLGMRPAVFPGHICGRLII